MTTPADSSGDDFLVGLDLSAAPPWRSTDDLNGMSLRAFRAHSGADRTARSVAAVRLHGAMVRQNRVSVRRATKILDAFQSVLTAIAASAQGSTGLRGKLPELASQLTDLQLSPQVAPGSVIFQLTAPDPADVVPEPLPGVDAESLVDASARRLLNALSVAADETASQRDLLEDLRGLGPRAARQLSSLMKAIIDESVELDLSWTTAGQERLGADVSAATAGALREVITTYRIDAEVVELRGYLATVSSFRNIDLRMADGEVVTLTAEEDLRGALGSLFEREVIVRAEETVESREFGEPRRTYKALSIEPV